MKVLHAAIACVTTAVSVSSFGCARFEMQSTTIASVNDNTYEGAVYYPPLPHLLVTDGEHGRSFQVVMLPDWSRPRTITWRSGIGSVSPSFTLTDGWMLSAVDGSVDSGAGAVIEAIGSVAGAALGRAGSLPAGLYRLDWNGSEWVIGTPVLFPAVETPEPARARSTEPVGESRRPLIESLEEQVLPESEPARAPARRVAGRAAAQPDIVCSDGPELRRGGRIVGGCATSDYPGVGVIRFLGRVHCTGTYVGNSRVVTAAHCVDGYAASHLTFGIGDDGRNPSREYQVSETHRHEDYNDETLENDIAVIVLEDEPTLLETVRLPDPGFVQGVLDRGESMTFVGYGYWVTASGRPYNLGIKAKVMMTATRHNTHTFEYGIPASAGTPGSNTCNGDSGGPALALDSSRSPVLVGVTSWGDRPCREFGVDARVDVYLTWLRAQGVGS